MSDSGELDALVVKVLSSDATLMGICTDGVFFDVAPPNARRFVLVHFDLSTDTGMFGDEAFESNQYLVKSVLMNAAASDSRAAALQIHTDLQGLEATNPVLVDYVLMRSQRVGRVRYTETDPASVDVRWFHRGASYELVAAPMSASLSLAQRSAA
jgi:hypothetical protein